MKLWALLAVMVVLFSCKQTPGRYKYAIKDFRSSLQTELTELVNHGIVYANNNLSKHASVDELMKLSNAESPVLRGIACRTLLENDSINLTDFIYNHLDDTATIIINLGEFGLQFTTVTDDLLTESKWETEEEKEKCVDKVIKEHSRLATAYKKVMYAPLKPEYYPIIRKMVTANKTGDLIEQALYALARYQKKEDIPFIREYIENYTADWGYYTFSLIGDFPDTSYWNIIKRFSGSTFYSKDM